MKRFIVAGVLLVCFNAEEARGSPLDCEGIRDTDQRNYCRAVSKNQKSYCEFIKDRDLRYKCRAMVK